MRKYLYFRNVADEDNDDGTDASGTGATFRTSLMIPADRVRGIVPGSATTIKILFDSVINGGGIALLNASERLSSDSVGESILLQAIKAPYKTILSNAGIENNEEFVEGNGINVVTGEEVDMVNSGIIDPVLVTKTALKNSVSVVTTIISADCVISTIRLNESS